MKTPFENAEGVIQAGYYVLKYGIGFMIL